MFRLYSNVTATLTNRHLALADKTRIRSVERLASGLRINKAPDDAAGLTASEQMRSQLSGARQGNRNAASAVALLQTADGAYQQIGEILLRLQALAVQNENAATNPAQKQAIQQEANELLAGITHITQTTQFNGKLLLSASEGIGGQLLFTSNRDGSTAIFVSDAADSATAVNLTPDGFTYTNPRWSPDKSKIAFFSDREGGSALFTMNADGTGITKVLDNVGGGAAWSPDGTQLSFIDADEIYTVLLDGTGLTQLTTDGAPKGEPDWSPDGSKIVFRSSGGGFQDIWTVNADGTNPTQLTANGNAEQYPRWSPDSSKIVFHERGGAGVSPGNIWVVNADGSGFTQITSGTGGDGDQQPTWTSDGARIIVDRNDELYMIDADGGNPVNLTENPAADGFPDGSAVTGSRMLDFFVGDGLTPSGDTISVEIDSFMYSGGLNLSAIDSALNDALASRTRIGAYQNRIEQAFANSESEIQYVSQSESVIRDADYAEETSSLLRAQILVQAGTSVQVAAKEVAQNVLTLLTP